MCVFCCHSLFHRLSVSFLQGNLAILALCPVCLASSFSSTFFNGLSLMAAQLP